jgi:alpha-1,3-rhamnosyl/mannosyltransferase
MAAGDAPFRTTLIPGAGGTWWEQRRLARAARGDRLDVFFAPAYTAPLGIGVATVVAIHDVSFFAHPEWFTWHEGARRRWLTGRAARAASRIITISEFSRREIVEHLRVSPSKVRVIRPGLDSQTPGRPAAGTGADAATDRPFAGRRVLYVGSIFNRRHVPDLIRAYSHLAQRHPGLSLDIVGDNRSHPRQDIERHIGGEGLEEQVRWHRYVPDTALRELYEAAHAFVFLSEYEGLGLTPLEALSTGVPAVLLDTPVAHESCGDAALYVPGGDLGAIERALERVLFDRDLRARLLAAAPDVLSRYNWTSAARETLAVLEASASGQPREPGGGVAGT